MKFFESIKMALESIRANKLRSFLTMLGIIIGISSVITIVSLGQGGQNAITGEFQKIGSANINITVDQAKIRSQGDYFTLEDVKQIKDKVDTVKYITPVVQKRGIASTDIKTKTAIIYGGNSDMSYINNFELIYGRFFSEKDVSESKSVVVMDATTARVLFGTEDAVERTLTIGPASSRKKVTVVGITKSSFSMFGVGDSDNIPAFIYTPITFVKNLYPEDFYIDTITLASLSQETSEQAGNEAKNIIESRHNSRGREIYKADNIFKQLEEVNKVLGIFTAFIGAVAAISLLVGGIGVMNIMLVSVTERTREIGIRKAVGATTNAILLQFLTESVIISLIGGIIGMIIGILGAEIIGIFAQISPLISPWVILGAILFSSAVGIFFGIYPAKKAAKLDPIEALRYE